MCIPSHILPPSFIMYGSIATEVTLYQLYIIPNQNKTPLTLSIYVYVCRSLYVEMFPENI